MVNWDKMTRLNSKLLFRLCIAILLPAFLVACGKAGPPIKPSQAAVNKAKESNETPPETPKKDRRILLDTLLE